MSHSCLSEKEQEKVHRLMVYYREAFSPTDEIDISSDIEMDLQVTDKSTFFIRPFHVKEDKPMSG